MADAETGQLGGRMLTQRQQFHESAFLPCLGPPVPTHNNFPVVCLFFRRASRLSTAAHSLTLP